MGQMCDLRVAECRISTVVISMRRVNVRYVVSKDKGKKLLCSRCNKLPVVNIFWRRGVRCGRCANDGRYSSLREVKPRRFAQWATLRVKCPNASRRDNPCRAVSTPLTIETHYKKCEELDDFRYKVSKAERRAREYAVRDQDRQSLEKIEEDMYNEKEYLRHRLAIAEGRSVLLMDDTATCPFSSESLACPWKGRRKDLAAHTQRCLHRRLNRCADELQAHHEEELETLALAHAEEIQALEDRAARVREVNVEIRDLIEDFVAGSSASSGH